METALLVLLHPGDFFFEPAQRHGRWLATSDAGADQHAPFLHPSVLFCVARRRERVRRRVLLFDRLSLLDIRIDHRRVTDDLGAPFALDLQAPIRMKKKNNITPDGVCVRPTLRLILKILRWSGAGVPSL